MWGKQTYTQHGTERKTLRRGHGEFGSQNPVSLQVLVALMVFNQFEQRQEG